MVNSLRINKAQSTIEFTLIFITLGVFLLGITRVWGWYIAKFPFRQPRYTRTRVLAGTPDDANPLGGNGPGLWPVYGYRPLTDDWIFAGKVPSEKQFLTRASSPAKRVGRRDIKTEEENINNAKKRAANLLTEINLRREADQLQSRGNFYQKKADSYRQKSLYHLEQAKKYKKLAETEGFYYEDGTSYYERLARYHINRAEHFQNLAETNYLTAKRYYTQAKAKRDRADFLKAEGEANMWKAAQDSGFSPDDKNIVKNPSLYQNMLDNEIKSAYNKSDKYRRISERYEGENEELAEYYKLQSDNYLKEAKRLEERKKDLSNQTEAISNMSL